MSEKICDVCKRPIEVEWPEVQPCAVDPNYPCRTKEQWAEWSLQDEKETHGKIMRTLAGEPDGFDARTVGARMAMVAKQLIDEKPELARPDRWQDLMSDVNRIYRRDHLVTVTVYEDMVEKVKLAVMPAERTLH